MERSHRALETIKTILIAALTLSAAVLLSVYWADFSLKALFSRPEANDTPVQTADAPKTREIIAPAEICVNLTGERGGAFATVFPEEYDAWQKTVTAFAAFSRSENASIEETTDASYQAVLRARSVRVTFAYSLPFDGFCKQFGIASAPFSAIRAVSELVFSEAAPDSLFLTESLSGTRYRLTGDEAALEPLSVLISEIGENEDDMSFTIEATLGEPNDALIPFGYGGTLRSVTAEKEIHLERRDTEADRFARLFFDNSLDFVRRVKDSAGTLTYMYNYTQKVLTVSMSGVAEYKEELAESSVAQGFYASLGTALSFVAEHGGWYPEVTVDGRTEENGLEPYLQNAAEIQTGHRTGYRYAFGFRAGDETLYAGEEAAIIVDVYDGQVTYYRRAVFANLAFTDLTADELCTLANAIAANSDWAYEVLAAVGTVPNGITGNERFRAVAGAVTRIRSGYLFAFSAETDTIDAAPVWTIRAGNVLLFFDLVTGAPVSYRVDTP